MSRRKHNLLIYNITLFKAITHSHAEVLPLSHLTSLYNR